MLGPADGKTYTIRLEMNGEEIQWCTHCRLNHTPTTRVEIRKGGQRANATLPDKWRTFDPYRDK
jgi:hypothetical protein